MSRLFSMLLAAGIGLSANAMAQNLSTETERTTTQSSQTEESVATQSKPGEQDATQAEQVPQQSMPSVGHPAEGGQTGQFGVKKFDESTESQGTSSQRNQ